MKKKILDTYRNINIRELIGLRVKVVTHSDPNLMGSEGLVLDETRSMFLVRMEDKDRKVSKMGAQFEFTVDGEYGPRIVTLKGDDLVFKPEDRTKKLEKKRIPNENIKEP